MKSIGTPNEHQRVDPQTGLIEPWYTFPALDEIKTWSLADKTVLEWGGGNSTIWWAANCRRVFTVEANPDWHARISSETRDCANLTLLLRDPRPASYAVVPEGCLPDIVVVDGSCRYECLLRALADVPRPFKLIFDNWQQKGVCFAPEFNATMAPYEGRVHPQPGYVHADASVWQTAIWEIR